MENQKVDPVRITWKRPTGTKCTTNDDPGTVAAATAMDWEEVSREGGLPSEGDVTEDDIMKMSAKDLDALVKEVGIDVDTSGMKIADARKAVIDAAFGSEE